MTDEWPISTRGGPWTYVSTGTGQSLHVRAEAPTERFPALVVVDDGMERHTLTREGARRLISAIEDAITECDGMSKRWERR